MTWPAGHPTDPVPSVSESSAASDARFDGWDAVSYELYLRSCGVLGHGFEARELLGGQKFKALPYLREWPNMVATLRLAVEFRRRLLRLAPEARGLNVVTARRSVNARKNSAHAHNRALDLTPVGECTSKVGRAMVSVAAELYEELRHEMLVGVGTYGRNQWTKVVHLDAGHRARKRNHKSATWTYIGDDAITPAVLQVLGER